MKKFIAIAFALLCFLSSCAKAPEYRDDIPCAELTAALESGGDYSRYGEEKIKYFFEDTDLADDYSLIYSTEPTDIDEFGVFRTADPESAEALYDIVLRYVEDMRKNDSAFIASYAPEELPKLERAKVNIYGNYVAYAILDEESANNRLSELENALIKK